MAKPRTVYRGKRRFGKVVTVVLFIVAVLLVLAVALFYYLQRYIVYEKDGLSLVLPYMRQEQSSDGGETGVHVYPSLSPDEVEIVVVAPDLANVVTTAGDDLQPLRASYISAADVSSVNLTLAASGANTSALVIELKPESGFLSYSSSVKTAADYGLGGENELGDTIDALKAQGIYLVASISCLIDNGMAERNPPVTLKTALGGNVVSDARGSWIDPYNRIAREYIAALVEEAAVMGFDEVLFTNVAHPDVENVTYSQTMTDTPDKTDSVSVYAKYVTDAARDAGLKASAVCYGDLLRQNESEKCGQDIGFFFAVFDRVCVETSSDYYVSDMQMLEGFLGEASDTRIVPMISGYTPENGSYIAK